MNNVFLDSITERKDLLKIEDLNINKFLLENNLKQIEDIQIPQINNRIKKMRHIASFFILPNYDIHP